MTVRELPQFDPRRVAALQDLVESAYRFETPAELPFVFYKAESDVDPEKTKLADMKSVENQLTAWGKWDEKLNNYIGMWRFYAEQEYAFATPAPVLPLECPQETILTPFGVPFDRPDADSVCIHFDEPVIRDLSDGIKRLEDTRDGWLKRGLMPDLLERIEFLLAETGRQWPISLPDYQSPLGLASKLMDTSDFMMAVLEQPDEVLRLMDFMADIMIEVVQEMERIAGGRELVRSPYFQPKGVRGAIWDDYVSVISPDSYRDLAPGPNDRVLGYMGKGHVHTCGPCMGEIAEAIMANRNALSFDVIFATPERVRRTEHLLQLKDQCRGRIVLNVVGMPFDLENFTVDFVKRMNEDGGVMFTSVGGSDAQIRRWLDVVRKAAN